MGHLYHLNHQDSFIVGIFVSSKKILCDRVASHDLNSWESVKLFTFGNDIYPILE